MSQHRLYLTECWTWDADYRVWTLIEWNGGKVQ